MKDEKKYLFDHPKNIKRALYLLYGCCILLFILDFVIHRHVNHRVENLWDFYPVYGFVSCVVLVRIATWMRTFLMREEDYYDDENMDDKAITDSDDVRNSKKTGDHHVDD